MKETETTSEKGRQVAATVTRYSLYIAPIAAQGILIYILIYADEGKGLKIDLLFIV